MCLMSMHICIFVLAYKLLYVKNNEVTTNDYTCSGMLSVSGGGLSVWEIVGIVTVCVLVLTLIIVIIGCYVKKHQKGPLDSVSIQRCPSI